MIISANKYSQINMFPGEIKPNKVDSVKLFRNTKIRNLYHSPQKTIILLTAQCKETSWFYFF